MTDGMPEGRMLSAKVTLHALRLLRPEDDHVLMQAAVHGREEGIEQSVALFDM